MPSQAARHRLRTSRALFFCAAFHVYVLGILVHYGGAALPWTSLMASVFALDVLFVLARKSSPLTIKAGDAEALTRVDSEGSACKECGARRYNKSWHCKVCNVCVVKWDCHCPLLNRCIGARNHAVYVSFLGAASNALYHVGQALRVCITSSLKQGAVEVVMHNALPLLGLGICLALFITAAGHLAWNCFLIAFDKTTPELLRPEKCHWLPAHSPRPPLLTLKTVLAIPSHAALWIYTECLRLS
eukprot:TRINITY_DN8554_c1_g2_i1.p1 TRINITY_DN8554_c1_g2~~TRINITY_DN8554_c1_g2_i1.p1  ORF type:complete len:244 (+),score=28.25 TRINITY_DN8554_c1_g2_i1:1101-1832(+)